jgi:dTDP-4-dehydrorhamnose 3,5-epimerase
MYKCSDFYDAKDGSGIIWNDSDVGIAWPLEKIGTPILSEKDKKLPKLKELF